MGVELFRADRLTDRHDGTVTFGKLANAPKVKSGWSNDVFRLSGLAL